MEKRLEGLSWKPMWTSHLGSVKGCLEYLGSDVSEAWLFGATGHAFVLNVHEAVCPSGPTAWKTEMLFVLAPNAGYEVEGVFTWKDRPDFREKQREAWDLARAALDEGRPCFGWELGIPEFSVIRGYDDAGYIHHGPCPDGVKEGRLAWDKLGASDIGVIELYRVKLCDPADDATAVRDALRFALEHAAGPAKWIFPKYASGLDGYDAWTGSLDSGTAHDWGQAYNAALWAECRGHAVPFLHEAAKRLGGGAGDVLSRAAEQYANVALNLTAVAEAFPFPPRGELKEQDRVDEAVARLGAARTFEGKGLNLLGRAVELLG